MKKSVNIAMLTPACALLSLGMTCSADAADRATSAIPEQLRILRDELAQERQNLDRLRSTPAQRDKDDPAREAAAHRAEQDVLALQREIERLTRAAPAPAALGRITVEQTPPTAATTTRPPWWDVYAQPIAARRHPPLSADSDAGTSADRRP
jgi:hypothetical protein